MLKSVAFFCALAVSIVAYQNCTTNIVTEDQASSLPFVLNPECIGNDRSVTLSVSPSLEGYISLQCKRVLPVTDSQFLDCGGITLDNDGSSINDIGNGSILFSDLTHDEYEFVIKVNQLIAGVREFDEDYEVSLTNCGSTTSGTTAPSTPAPPTTAPPTTAPPTTPPTPPTTAPPTTTPPPTGGACGGNTCSGSRPDCLNSNCVCNATSCPSGQECSGGSCVQIQCGQGTMAGYSFTNSNRPTCYDSRTVNTTTCYRAVSTCEQQRNNNVCTECTSTCGTPTNKSITCGADNGSAGNATNYPSSSRPRCVAAQKTFCATPCYKPAETCLNKLRNMDRNCWECRNACGEPIRKRGADPEQCPF